VVFGRPAVHEVPSHGDDVALYTRLRGETQRIKRVGKEIALVDRANQFFDVIAARG